MYDISYKCIIEPKLHSADGYESRGFRMPMMMCGEHLKDICLWLVILWYKNSTQKRTATTARQR